MSADKHFVVFPVASVDTLAAQLASRGPGTSRLKVYGDYENGHLWLQVIDAPQTASSQMAAIANGTAAPTDPPPINDSWLCPGAPGCP